MLILSLFAAAQIAAPPEEQSRENLSEIIYYASIAATGSKLCDRERSARYSAQFNRRYGERVRALQEYHVRRFGPDPDFVVLTDCIRARAPGRQQDTDHARALDRFEAVLRDLEQRFGAPSNGS